MRYFHVDVFSTSPLNGNGLTIVFPETALSPTMMLEITKEFRQFETIFVLPEHNGCYPARIFTVDEELDFAGHPLIGAAAAVHQITMPNNTSSVVCFNLHGRTIPVFSEKRDNYYTAAMNQGTPAYLGSTTAENCADIIASLNLSLDDIDERHSIEIISTGLPYLLLPLKKNIDKAAITAKNFEELLSRHNAKFIYLFDTNSLECRTWDNRGITEDVATGSAAGPLCAYLVKNGYRNPGDSITIYQGKYAGRPSIISTRVDERSCEVFVEGAVSFFAEGSLTAQFHQ